ncbi:molybdenum cofactor guanylyltransferase [Sporosarcina sp. YIM B06819]|uniref:molybdenum cofactor guanylyltransferase n=1 Tax=Sporosarcina sp. YIM B06819 TaxID=3081769 RepID=UPI00298CC1C9|nr:molybdenum cofactor guanylyltransferase [Sporosarcina sp. YIM B06819]
MTRTVGVVLAGGLSLRFGSPKAFAKLDNRYFYERATEALKAHCDEVIIVTRRELLECFPEGITAITDIIDYKGLGPLAGILSAMESVEADRYIVLPCDMPYVDEAVIGKLLLQHEQRVTAVVVDGRQHPLVSIWDSRVKGNLQEALDNGQLRVMPVLAKSGVRWIDGGLLTDDEKRVFTNVNTPGVLEGS